jgi:hypothetical protein
MWITTTWTTWIWLPVRHVFRLFGAKHWNGAKVTVLPRCFHSTSMFTVFFTLFCKCFSLNFPQNFLLIVCLNVKMVKLWEFQAFLNYSEFLAISYFPKLNVECSIRGDLLTFEGGGGGGGVGGGDLLLEGNFFLGSLCARFFSYPITMYDIYFATLSLNSQIFFFNSL